MKNVIDVFNASMGLMDELSANGEARTNDTKEYEHRTPGIVNMMISEFRILSGLSGGFVGVETMDDPILKVDDTYAIGVMQYGLAANLLIDENPTAASFFEQRYEEMRNLYFSRRPSDAGESIEDMYGGIEYGRFGKW